MKIGFSSFASCLCSSSSSTTSTTSRRSPGRSAGLVPEKDTLGHSFLYVSPITETTGTTTTTTTQLPPPAPPPPQPSSSSSPSPTSSSPVHHPSEGNRKGQQQHLQSSFKSLSGVTVSANPTSSRLKNPLVPSDFASRGAFESSHAFSAAPLRISAADRGLFLSGPIAPSTAGRRFSRCRSETSSRRAWVTPLRSFGNRRSRSRSRSAFAGGGGGGGGGTEQWVQGKAGEDRIHVVVSEEQQWLFVGIYDGFNGTDAADFLLCSLYSAVFNQLKGLFWDFFPSEEEQGVGGGAARGVGIDSRRPEDGARACWLGNWLPQLRYSGKEKTEVVGGFASTCDETTGRGRIRRTCRTGDHKLVLEALARALEMTEAAYFEMLEGAMELRPEIALVGSCLLVVLMRGTDVYVMNLGDSRAIVAQYNTCHEEEEATRDAAGDSSVARDREVLVVGEDKEGALQLSVDHSTSNADEAIKIKEEHQDDRHCIINSRVKGRLKITRAFGAAFLKEPKWNNRLLKMFRCQYIGTAPYVSSSPSLRHHRVGPDDKFLVISSDGIYQYLTNEEVVSHLRYFMENSPYGDPAQRLVEETLLRAADNAGMDFKGLLDIPQGDRRKFHDDVSVVVISLEGRIWKSTGKCL